MTAIVLTLSALEAFDPYAPDNGGRERRFNCPLPACEDKRKTAGHRSVSVDKHTGAWLCFRCGQSGKLKEFWQERAGARAAGGGALGGQKMDRRAKARRELRQAFALSEPPPKNLPSSEVFAWRQHLRDVKPLLDTPGSAYLHDRGISVGLSHLCGVRYSPDWFGRPAILFPGRDRAQQLVAAQGRYLDNRAPKMRSAGQVGAGVFSTLDAWESDTLILVEAPCCALTLALEGFPAIALLGAGNCPDWLPSACAFKRILIGLDGDDAGDAAAVRLAEKLRPFAAGVERLRPCWFKDWNELAPRLPEGLKAALVKALSSNDAAPG